MITVQLANTYNPAKNYKPDFWYATPKFDGVRAVFIPHEGFFTRNNKPIHGLAGMAEFLEGYCESCGLSFVDGELIVKGKSFQAAQSAVMSKNSDKSGIEYHVFAAGGNFSATIQMLNLLPDFPEAGIFRVNSTAIHNNHKAVEDTCRIFTDMGYEGVVLRDPFMPYFEGRNDSLLKYKFFREADLRITGTFAGEGKLAGTLGGVYVGGKIDGVNVRAKVGTGLTDEDRRILFADKNLTGKTLTVKYQSLTDKPDSEGYYSLRFPVFVGIKEDRDFDVPEAVTDTPKFTGKSNCKFHRNGDVEATFQIEFVNRPVKKISVSVMDEWKSKLSAGKTAGDVIRIIGGLKLTVSKILELAKYLGLSLSGCRYIKSEIVRRFAVRLIEGRFIRECLNSRKNHTGSNWTPVRGLVLNILRSFWCLQAGLTATRLKHSEGFTRFSRRPHSLRQRFANG